jgi:hypothetical protein
MTSTPTIHQDVRKDRRVDSCVDGRKADNGSPRLAFVIVLSNHLCRIRHRWFCAEALVMPSRQERQSSSAC